MKKKFLIGLFLGLCAVFCTLGLVGCDNNKSYYGTYYGGLDLKEKVVIGKTLTWNDKKYDYSIENNSISLLDSNIIKNPVFKMFENGNVLSAGITYNFDSGSINVRNGNFNANLSMFTSNLSLDYSYSFNNSGTYQFITPSSPLYCHNGEYTLKNGILKLNGANPLGKSVDEIFYIEAPNKLHYGVYVKDGFLSENSNKENEPQNNNPPQNQDVFYNISYSAGEGGIIQGLINQTVIENGNSESVTAIPNEGYEFIGWSDGVTTATRQELNVQSNMTVTANFKALSYYNITFVYNNGEANQNIVLKENAQLKLTTPKNLGYSFIGWQVNGSLKQSDEEILVTSDMTLYAEWEINSYSITYNLNGGFLENAVTTFTINDLPLDLQIPTGETDNLSFVKWTTGEGGNTEINVIERKEENLKDFSLYAFYEDSANFLTYKYNSELNGYEVTGYNGNATKVVIPSKHKGVPVTSIGSYAFDDCSSLTGITIPNSVTSIGSYAFDACSSLTSITIPNSVTSIENDAFKYCRSLTSITIPNSVTSIRYGAFYACSSLTSITIPNSVIRIENGAFSGCSSLTEIIIPNSVTSIGEGAFSDCSSLTSITIPKSVTDIGSDAFEYCSSLTEIYVDSMDVINSLEDHCLFDYAETVYIRKDIEVTNSLFSVVFKKESENIYTVEGVDYYKYILKGE